MKKYMFFLIYISFALCISMINIKANTEDVYAKNAESAILMEYNSKKIVFEKNADKELYPASMTKMMGLILIFEALNSHKLSYDDKVKTSSYAASMGGSQIFLEQDEEMKVIDLIKSICISSANDAMVAMAEKISGSEKDFVKKMNEKAKTLNLSHTNFVNCTGLHDNNHYSSAKDMAEIAHYLLEVGGKKLLKITSTYDDYIREDKGQKFWLVNTNKLIRQYKGVDGLKTGYTSEAKSCITISAKRNNMRFIVVVMKEPDSKTRNEEVIKLLDYGFSLFEKVLFFKKNEVITEYIDRHVKDESIPLYCEEDVYAVCKKGEKLKIISNEIEYLNTSLPFKKNDRIAKMHLHLNNGETHTSYLICKKDIHEKVLLDYFWDSIKHLF